jgi:hypothetical protein
VLPLHLAADVLVDGLESPLLTERRPPWNQGDEQEKEMENPQAWS